MRFLRTIGTIIWNIPNLIAMAIQYHKDHPDSATCRELLKKP
jgi:hypothetical protein